MDLGGEACDAAERDDLRLVVQALAGDQGAWNALYHRYLPSVWSLSWSIVRNDDDAHEVVQKTFIKVSEKLAGYRAPLRTQPAHRADRAARRRPTQTR